MKFKITAVLILLAGELAFGQIVNIPGAANAVIRESTYSVIEGSPYYYPDFRSGTMQTRTQTYSNAVFVRYDCYKDEIQFQQNDAEMIASPSQVTGFSFHQLDKETNTVTSLVFRNGFKVEDYGLMAYFNVAYDGNVKCLKKFSVVYTEEASSTYGNPNGIKRFDRKERAFVLFSDGTSEEVNGNRKAILSHFGKHEAVMSQFIKDNKLNLKDDKDLIKVLEKFDGLGA